MIISVYQLNHAQVVQFFVLQSWTSLEPCHGGIPTPEKVYIGIVVSWDARNSSHQPVIHIIHFSDIMILTPTWRKTWRSAFPGTSHRKNMASWPRIPGFPCRGGSAKTLQMPMTRKKRPRRSRNSAWDSSYDHLLMNYFPKDPRKPSEDSHNPMMRVFSWTPKHQCHSGIGSLGPIDLSKKRIFTGQFDIEKNKQTIFSCRLTAAQPGWAFDEHP